MKPALLITLLISFQYKCVENVIVISDNETLQLQNLNFTEMAEVFGQTCVEYDVQTEDGYILKLFRIPGRGKPVLLTHGIFDSADVFIERGNGSLSVILAENSYDVWLTNVRGNKYSRRHSTLSPETPAFWDFSFHEHGIYDMAASIDFILNQTGREKLDIIGHSQGTTVFFVLGSTRPEYNNKVSLLIGLAPVCSLRNVSPALRAVLPFAPFFNRLLKLLGLEELLGEHSIARNLIVKLCSDPKFGYKVCLNLFNFPVVGFDSAELEPSFLPTYFGHFPLGSSRKNVFHFAQVAKRNIFAQYDYGVVMNLAKYNTAGPPRYDLSRVTMKTILFVGKNDGLASIEDAIFLRNSLPNVAGYYVLDPPKFNHIDFVLGRNTYKVLYPNVVETLDTFSIGNK